MPALTRNYCTGCKESIYNCVVDGVRVPLLVRITVGQPSDTGPALDINGPGVQVPSFLREIMQTPLARMELCVKCAAKAFGVPLVTAAEDPLYDANLDGIPDAKQVDATLPMVEQLHRHHARTLQAIYIGRGDPDALVPVPNAPADTELARLRAENEALRQAIEEQAPAAAAEPEEEEAATL